MIFLAEIHQPLCRFCFQMENIQGGFCIIGSIESCPQLRIFEHLSGSLQLVPSMDTVVDRFAFFNFFLKIFNIS